MAPVSKTSRPKLLSIRKLKAKAWKRFSVYIRSKLADVRGYIECYTCRRKYHWKEVHAGHYKHGVLDFDEMNIHPQCVKCNMYDSGNRDEYYIRLVKDYGQRAVDDLRQRAANFKGYTRQELNEIIEKYKEYAS